MLRIVECEYPNPDYKYGVFYLGDHEIGRAAKADGGWIPHGKRKALPDEMAAKAMIDSAISKARRDEAHARKMLEALRMYCGGKLPPDGKVTPNPALGKCCYGGVKTKKDCASCGAWKVLEISTCTNSQTEPDA